LHFGHQTNPLPGLAALRQFIKVIAGRECMTALVGFVGRPTIVVCDRLAKLHDATVTLE
jgi:hypothetical protein